MAYGEASEKAWGWRPAGLLAPPRCPQSASVLLSQEVCSVGPGLPLLFLDLLQLSMHCFLLREGSYELAPWWGEVGGQGRGGMEERVLESHMFCHPRPATRLSQAPP